MKTTHKIFYAVIFLLVLVSWSIRSESQEVIADFSDQTLPVLNDELQRIQNKILSTGQDLNSLNSFYVAYSSTTSGHDHDGTDSKKVLYTNLDLTGAILPSYSEFFTADGTFTVPDGVSMVFVTMVGGGGGGRGGQAGETSQGGGGSGAEYIRIGVKVTPGNTYTVTVGAAGAAGASGLGAGGDGGVSSFPADNVTLSCNGGTGATTTSGGAGGTASGTAKAPGTPPAGGGVGLSTAGVAGRNYNGELIGGGGAGSSFGIGGTGGHSGDAGNVGTGYGSGGGGAGGSANVVGGAGKGGMVYLEW